MSTSPGPANPGYTPLPTDSSAGWYLSPVAPPPPPPRGWPAWKLGLIIGAVIAASLAIAFVAGSLGDDEPAEQPTAGIGTPAPYSPLPAATPVKEQGGRDACAAVKAALAAGGKLDPVAMASIAATGVTSRNTSIQLASQALDGRAELAVAARGAPDEQRMLDGLAESARNLETTCATHGYYRP